MSEGSLVAGFDYPATFNHAVRIGLTFMEPWYILTGPRLEVRQKRVASLELPWDLVPFAATTTGDEVAAFRVDNLEVYIIEDHAFGGTGDVPRILPNFEAWLREAIEDFIYFASH